MTRIKWRCCRGWCLSANDDLLNTCDPHHKFWLYIYIYIFSVFSVFNFVSFYFVFILLYPFWKSCFFSLFGVCFVLAAGGQFQWVRDCKSRLNLNPMEEGLYDQHVAGGNPSAYMSMRDYRNQPWQSQQPVERNPNEYRSMTDYRNQ